MATRGKRAGLDGRLMKLEERDGRKICDGDRVEFQSGSVARRGLDDPLCEGWKWVESNCQFNCTAGREAGQRTGEQKFIDYVTKDSCFLEQFLLMIFRHKDSQNVTQAADRCRETRASLDTGRGREGAFDSAKCSSNRRIGGPAWAGRGRDQPQRTSVV